MVDIVIQGGRVVREGELLDADLAIAGEVISHIGTRGSTPPAREIIDARGMYVLPGLIDPHVHFNVWNEMADNFASTAVSAAFGGVTTMLPFVVGRPDMGVREALQYFIEEGQRASVVDFALHCRLRPDRGVIDQVPDAIELGVTSLKMYLAYRKRGFEFDDDLLMRAMEVAAATGALAMVHAENGGVIDYLEDRFIAGQQTTPEYYLRSRPHVAESEAVHRSLAMAALTQCRLYVVHVSTSEAVDEIARGRARSVPVVAETCPQYLLLSDADLVRQGALAKVAPPLRWDKDREALWRAIQQGIIETIGSDHAPYTTATKATGSRNIFDAPFGMPGVETMFPLMFTEGVCGGRLSIVDMVKVMSENTAKIFGLYPRKGVLRTGSDADILLIEPEATATICASKLRSRADYTCFEGWPIRGRLVRSFLRGRPLISEGKLGQSAGYGTYLARQPVKR